MMTGMRFWRWSAWRARPLPGELPRSGFAEPHHTAIEVFEGDRFLFRIP
jgi:hypothetical protein